MSEKGLATKNIEKLAIQGLDKLIPAEGITEVASDAVIRLFIPVLDNQILDSIIPEEISARIRKASEAVTAENYDAASDEIAEVIAELTAMDESELQIAAYKKTIETFMFWVLVGIEKKQKD